MKPFVMDDKKKMVGKWLGGGSLVAALYSVDPVSFAGYINKAFEHQVFVFMAAFAVTAFFHSGRIKSEIRSQFSSLVNAIERLGEKLENRIERVEVGLKEVHEKVDQTNSRVLTLEKLKE